MRRGWGMVYTCVGGDKWLLSLKCLFCGTQSGSSVRYRQLQEMGWGRKTEGWGRKGQEGTLLLLMLMRPHPVTTTRITNRDRISDSLGVHVVEEKSAFARTR